MIYVFTLFLIYFLNQVWLPGKLQKNRKKYCTVISIWLLFLLFFRHAYVGSDTQMYVHIFKEIGKFGLDVTMDDAELSTEYGFYYLNYILNKLSLPFRSLILISASFYIWTITYVIYKFSKSPAFSYFIFLTFGYFIFNTTMRQCFALSFCTWAFLCIINRRRLIALFLILCGVLFHSTAIVFIIAFIVPYLKYNKKSFVIILLSGAFISIFAIPIYKAAGELTGKVYYSVQETTGYVSLAINIILVIFGYVYRKKLSSFDRCMMYMIIVSIILFPVASLNPALFRIRMYFSFYAIVYAANIVTVKAAYNQLLAALLIAYGLYSFFIGNHLAGIRVIPYAFWWEDYEELNPAIRALKLYPPD